MNEGSQLLESLKDTWERLLVVLPEVLMAFGLLFAGWLVAKLIRRLAIRLFRLVRLDALAERTGLEDFLIQGGVKQTTVTLLAGGLYWVVLLGVFVAVLDGLGVEGAGLFLTRLANYVPNIALAVVILAFGTLLARVVGTLVYTYLNNIGTPAAEPIGAIARYALLVFVVFMAAEQLAIKYEVLASAFQIAFAAVCFGLALAFGLGGRRWAADLITRYTRK
jgi:hypothetical protein